MEDNEDIREMLYDITAKMCESAVPNKELDDVYNAIMLKEELEPTLPLSTLFICAMRADRGKRLEGTRNLFSKADDIDNPIVASIFRDNFEL